MEEPWTLDRNLNRAVGPRLLYRQEEQPEQTEDSKDDCAARNHFNCVRLVIHSPHGSRERVATAGRMHLRVRYCDISELNTDLAVARHRNANLLAHISNTANTLSNRPNTHPQCTAPQICSGSSGASALMAASSRSRSCP